jgi:hypothetical protein
MADNQFYSTINIYIIADIDMHDHDFKPIIDALRSRFEVERIHAIARIIHPYSGSSLLKQLFQMLRDIKIFPDQVEKSLGGQKVRQQVKILGSKEPILLIGHGAGGIAAYHAAELLEKQDKCDIRFIAQIGSPKVPIGPSFQDRVGYITNKGLGYNGEPSSWQGGWSHPKYRFKSHRYPGLLFNSKEKGRRFYAPNRVVQINAGGQQSSYYSTTHGIGVVSNLAKTLNVIWDWFHSTNKSL